MARLALCMSRPFPKLPFKVTASLPFRGHCICYSVEILKKDALAVKVGKCDTICALRKLRTDNISNDSSENEGNWKGLERENTWLAHDRFHLVFIYPHPARPHQTRAIELWFWSKGQRPTVNHLRGNPRWVIKSNPISAAPSQAGSWGSNEASREHLCGVHFRSASWHLHLSWVQLPPIDRSNRR